MTPFARSLLALALASTTLSAQRSILFTPGTAEKTSSGSNGTSLEDVRNHEIGIVTPAAAGAYSAELFGHTSALQTLAGDHDGDFDVLTPNFLGAIDAILVTPWDYSPALGYRLRQNPVSLADVYFSPSVDIGTNVSGAPGLRRGDCGRFTRTAAGNGRVDRFVSAEQLVIAFHPMNPVTMQPLGPSDIDLDGITVSPDRDIYVTFAEDYMIQVWNGAGMVTLLLQDGAVGVIPAAAWAPNALGNVASVAANRGVPILSEAGVAALAVNALAADRNGALVGPLIDTKDLALDIDGGTFTVNWGGTAHVLRDILFTGETLTGCGVLSTRTGGSIAMVNGRALARSVGAGATNGAQMGLAPSPGMGALGAIETLASEPTFFTLGARNLGALGGAVQVDVGANFPVGAAVIGLGLGTLPVANSIPVAGFALNSTCFPELYTAILPNPLIPVALAPGLGGMRFGTLSFASSPAIPLGIVWQAACLTPGGTLQVSTPLTLH